RGEPPAVLAARAQEADPAGVGEPLHARLADSQQLGHLPRREGTLDGLDLLWRTPALVVGHVLGHARHADCPAAVVRECAPGAPEPPHVAVRATDAELRHVTLEVAQGAGNLGLDPGAVLGMYQRHHVLESGGEAPQL